MSFYIFIYASKSANTNNSLRNIFKPWNLPLVQISQQGQQEVFVPRAPEGNARVYR